MRLSCKYALILEKAYKVYVNELYTFWVEKKSQPTFFISPTFNFAEG